MLVAAYIEINCIALAILFLISFNVYQPVKKQLFEQKLFMGLICSNVILLVLDSFMWFLDGKNFFMANVIYMAVTVLYYVMNPMPCYIWLLYSDYLLYKNEGRTIKLSVLFAFPAIINAFFSILSIFENVEFFIDKNNVYHRGRLFLVMAGICFFYLSFAMVNIIRNRKRLQQGSFLPLLVFAFPPYIGAVLQSIFYGISVVWICMTVSLLIIFINIQNNQLYTDYLTGLYNRKQLDNFLAERSKSNAKSNLLGGIMIDLNSFKKINDVYGHLVGDEALETAGKIIKKSFRKNDLVARYGGDEFVVIAEVPDDVTLAGLVKRLRENAEKFNKTASTPYKINFSIGYGIFDCKSGRSIQDFMTYIDGLMYEDKKSQKAVIYSFDF